MASILIRRGYSVARAPVISSQNELGSVLAALG
jgi:hypothetical protein